MLLLRRRVPPPYTAAKEEGSPSLYGIVTEEDGRFPFTIVMLKMRVPLTVALLRRQVPLTAVVSLHYNAAEEENSPPI